MNELFIRNAALKCFSQRVRKPIYRRRNFAVGDMTDTFAAIIEAMEDKLKNKTKLSPNDEILLTYALSSYCQNKGPAGLDNLLKDNTIEHWLQNKLGTPATQSLQINQQKLIDAMRTSMQGVNAYLKARGYTAIDV